MPETSTRRGRGRNNPALDRDHAWWYCRCRAIIPIASAALGWPVRFESDPDTKQWMAMPADAGSEPRFWTWLHSGGTTKLWHADPLAAAVGLLRDYQRWKADPSRPAKPTSHRRK
jgi:hypothetical protein